MDRKRCLLSFSSPPHPFPRDQLLNWVWDDGLAVERQKTGFSDRPWFYGGKRIAEMKTMQRPRSFPLPLPSRLSRLAAVCFVFSLSEWIPPSLAPSLSAPWSGPSAGASFFKLRLRASWRPAWGCEAGRGWRERSWKSHDYPAYINHSLFFSICRSFKGAEFNFGAGEKKIGIRLLERFNPETRLDVACRCQFLTKRIECAVLPPHLGRAVLPFRSTFHWNVLHSGCSTSKGCLHAWKNNFSSSWKCMQFLTTFAWE